jgi:hypothetical protein
VRSAGDLAARQQMRSVVAHALGAADAGARPRRHAAPAAPREARWRNPFPPPRRRWLSIAGEFEHAFGQHIGDAEPVLDDAYDNAMAESFFVSLECEWIESWYNPRRRHSGPEVAAER